jgi:hypothetical protein
VAAQIAREPHSIGDPDPTRKRELGEVEVNLDSGPRRIRVAHDPQNGALHLHGIAILTAELDPALVRSFEATAAAFNQAQGREEQETQRILLGALLDRVMRRHKSSVMPSCGGLTTNDSPRFRGTRTITARSSNPRGRFSMGVGAVRGLRRHARPRGHEWPP